VVRDLSKVLMRVLPVKRFNIRIDPSCAAARLRNERGFASAQRLMKLRTTDKNLK
jgi:hypothetical protein